MIPLKEKLAREQQNTQQIYLYKEGGFWRAYGVSCLLVHRLLPHVKVWCNSKDAKSYAFVSIRQKHISTFEEKLRRKQAQEEQPSAAGVEGKLRVYTCPISVSHAEYEAFLHQRIQKQTQPPKSAKIVVLSNERIAMLLETIQGVDVHTLTPVDALVKLHELKELVDAMQR